MKCFYTINYIQYNNETDNHGLKSVLGGAVNKADAVEPL